VVEEIANQQQLTERTSGEVFGRTAPPPPSVHHPAQQPEEGKVSSSSEI
jgi:hypothetical protein